MKQLIKYYLVWGFSLSLLALIARRLAGDPESLDTITGAPQPNPDPSGSDAQDRTPPVGPRVPDPSVTFTGTIVQSGGHSLLRETSGVLYPLETPGCMQPHSGEKVRVTGRIDLSSHLLRVEAIEHAA